MSAVALDRTLHSIKENFRTIAPHRDSRLFSKFLVEGYRMISLDTLPGEKFSSLLRAKLCLGSLITLYDDFADRKDLQNPELLRLLYQLDFSDFRTKIRSLFREQSTVVFATTLFEEISSVLCPLDNYHLLLPFLNFDLRQFYSSNHYSSLLTESPYFHSRLENKLYGHHNMGMLMASSMDLMALPSLRKSELGAIREVFLMGQRVGRISNVLSTLEREKNENDVTGELTQVTEKTEFIAAKKQMLLESRALVRSIKKRQRKIRSFSTEHYAEGLNQVALLHQEMEGII